MGLFAFKRLREQEAASQDAASFTMQSQQQEQPAEKPRRKRQARVKTEVQ